MATQNNGNGHTGIFQTLSMEHEQVSQLFEDVENTSGEDKELREELFEKIKVELLAHAKAEDAVFYPALAQHEKTKEIVGHALEEHEEVKQLLQELDGMSLGTQGFMQKLRKLKESVEHHVQEEEQKLFPKAQELLSKKESQALDEEYKERRAAES
ncbi:MAG: hemerythrin domain-containing protein [Myxococcales bacterium]|nr:hemerythrin domain-containing protein [Myxococcales bacterium]